MEIMCHLVCGFHVLYCITFYLGLISTTKSSPGMSESRDAKLKPTELKQESDSLDFASKIRSEIVIEYREDKDLSPYFDVSGVLRYDVLFMQLIWRACNVG